MRLDFALPCKIDFRILRIDKGYGITPPMYTIPELLELNDSHLLTDEILDSLSREQTIELAIANEKRKAALLKAEPILFYRPTSPRAIELHLAVEKQVLATGGNRSSKTDTALADLVICMTKIVPISLRDVYPMQKIQCPMRARIVCESLTTTWEPVIKRKLQWNQWNGRGEPGGPFGHWGWIPQRFLIKGKWDESWSEKNRTLTLMCGCTIQVMAYGQEEEDFSGASLHRVIEDEAPPSGIHRENLMRTIDTKGQVYAVFTPPDDPGKAIRAAWIYDTFEKGMDGPGKDPDVKSITLFTEENKILDASEIEIVAKGLSPAERETRLYGAFMHLTGRIYPVFTDRVKVWCFQCKDVTIAANDEWRTRYDLGKLTCATCAGGAVEFCHIIDPDIRYHQYPVVFLLDPHPRKPNMMAWISVDPCDDYCQIHEMEVDGDPTDVRDMVFAYERDNGINIVARLIDPNMAESPAHSAGRRHITVRDEFDAVGIRCALADDEFSVGMKRVRSLLEPDEKTQKPRIHLFSTCQRSIRQFNRYAWSEWTSRSSEERDSKDKPRNKEDDYPTLWRYFCINNYTFSGLRMGREPIRAARRRSYSEPVEDRSWIR